jgi:hypothetical protein
VSGATSVCLNNMANLFTRVKKRTDLMMAATDCIIVHVRCLVSYLQELWGVIKKKYLLLCTSYIISSLSSYWLFLEAINVRPFMESEVSVKESTIR